MPDIQIQSQVKLIPHPGGARALWKASIPDLSPGIAWLGQAGFAIRYMGQRLLIDPYLSDYLARKYKGNEFPHTRMITAPLELSEIRGLNGVLCSHRHGDHMDPGSLVDISVTNPNCRFVVPKAETKSAMAIGLGESRIIPVNDGDIVRLGASISVRILPSAHEELKMNAAEEHYFIGFILRVGRISIYHSGDSIVYEGLSGKLREQRVSLALLPVNGRNADLTSKGIIGNMNFDEARDLCLASGIGTFIPHHFGMFDFNTIHMEELQGKIEQIDAKVLQCVLPSTDVYYELV